MVHARRRALTSILPLALVLVTLTPATPALAVVDPHWCSDSTGPLSSYKQTPHFAIWYDGAIDGGLTIGDYAAVLENVWATEIGSFGWARPPSLATNPAPGGRYPVRIEPAESDYGSVSNDGAHAGLVGDNPFTGWAEAGNDAQASCMVLNEGFDTIGSANLDDLKVTAAHEFFHSITNGLGVRNELDRSYREGGASWMEDEVYDSINDNYQYLYPQWQQSMGAFPDDPKSLAYDYWLVWRGLTEIYGSGVPGGAEDVMQRILTLVSKGKKQMPATEKAFEAEHTVLAYAYHQTAIAARFMKPCGGGYVRPFCYEEAAGYVAEKAATFPVDGTVTKTRGYRGSVREDYALNWVKLPDTPKTYPIHVKNLSANTPLFWSVACDVGTELRVDIWAPLEPDKTSNLGVLRKGCVGPSYVTVTSGRSSAGNPTASPKADYKVWVPFSPITGTLTWSVTGSRSGTEGNITWDESWTESGSLALSLKRDPVNLADYLVVDNGSTYTIGYTFNRTAVNSFTGCTTTYHGVGDGSGTPTTPSYMGSTYPNLDPPDPADPYPDSLGISFGAPLTYTEETVNSCGGTGSVDLDGAGPYYHGLEGFTLPVCLPPALVGADPMFVNAGAFVGAWNEASQRYEFACSKTLPVPDGSQTVTVTGTASYPSPP